MTLLGVRFINEDRVDVTQCYVPRIEHDAVRAQLRDALAEVERLRALLAGSAPV